MSAATSISLGVWLNCEWLVQIQLTILLASNFFIAYRLRDLQNIGTSWLFVLIYSSSLFVFGLLGFSSSVTKGCNNHVLQAIAYCGYCLCQLITVLMLFTVRQNSLSNYARLPIWFLTLGALFQLATFVLFVYQAIFLASHPFDEIPANFAKVIKILYCLGLIGPLLQWLFIYFLIIRLNDKVRRVNEPSMLDTQDTLADNDQDVVEKTSHDINVTYEDNRLNY